MAATQLEAQAAVLERRASLLQAEALGLPSLLDPVAARCDAAVWVGPAASRLSDAHGRRRAELRQSGEELTMRARALSAQAAQLRARAAELLRVGSAALFAPTAPGSTTALGTSVRPPS